MKIRITGLEPTLEMLEQAGDINSRLIELRKKFAHRTLAASQRITPVGKTGALHARTTAVVIGNSVIFANPMEYARYVELGTGRRGGASYLPYIEGEEIPSYASYWPGMVGVPFLRKPIAKGIEDFFVAVEILARDIGDH